MSDYKKDESEIGAMWIKQGPKGEYMTGVISGVNVVVFRNVNKRSEKQPDYRVLKSKPREERTAPVTRQQDPDDDIAF